MTVKTNYYSLQQVRMEAAALSLLLYLVMNSLESGETGAEISLSPKRLQFFKYGTFYVSCEEEEEEEERTQWRVTKRATDGEVTSCLSPCRVSPAFPSTDTGVYWCETGPGSINSNTINNINISTVSVTITDGAVLLESPDRPVAEGDDVTLRCRTKGETSISADFYKDGVFIGSSSATGDMTIRNVSRSDEGLYRCNVSGGGEGSPDSWVKVKAPPGGQEEPLMSTFTILRHLVVATPYLLSTVVLGLIYRDRRRELRADETQRPSDDVIMQIAI